MVAAPRSVSATGPAARTLPASDYWDPAVHAVERERDLRARSGSASGPSAPVAEPGSYLAEIGGRLAAGRGARRRRRLRGLPQRLPPPRRTAGGRRRAARAGRSSAATTAGPTSSTARCARPATPASTTPSSTASACSRCGWPSGAGCCSSTSTPTPRRSRTGSAPGSSPSATPSRWRRGRRSCAQTHPIACNWKTYSDNYLEGYHIPFVHPALARASTRRPTRSTWRTAGSGTRPPPARARPPPACGCTTGRTWP